MNAVIAAIYNARMEADGFVRATQGFADLEVILIIMCEIVPL
jgi:hypothetical protein